MLRLALLLPLAAVAVAHAQPAPAQPELVPFALVVGSNAGGPGQQTLKYAQEDANRVGAVLSELGGYPRSNVDVVLAPTPDVMRARLDALAARVKAVTKAGKQARVTFYYSGHARATALDLGNAQLPLAELRARLFDVPAQITVVVLDACQSGAFSRVKGGTPAADFSFNSKSQLAAKGVAVLASSTGSELSQESEQLRSSYFTHHLLVGLRGAGDTNGDGLVTIDEAYRYAYHQTLLATAETAVGGQHVTFEVDLKGHGDVPMSFPRAATSSITLPASLEGKTLVENPGARVVVAELYKAKGASVKLAVVPGEYQVLVRRGSELSRCKVSAGRGGATVDLARCSTEKVVAAISKGEALDGEWIERDATTRYRRPYRIALQLQGGQEREDDYTERLETFGYFEDRAAGPGLSLSLLQRLSRHLWVGGVVAFAQGPSWSRVDQRSSLAIEWGGGMFGGQAEGLLPFARQGGWEKFALYANATAGLAIARTTFTDGASVGAMTTTSSDMHLGPALAAGAGLHVETRWLGGLGLSIGYQWVYQRAIDNLAGDTHASGGHRITLGMFHGF